MIPKGYISFLLGAKMILQFVFDNILPAYNEALNLYRNQDWVKAIDAFKASDALEDMFPGRKTNPSQIYIPRCEHYRDNPPGDNWDGSWALTKK